MASSAADARPVDGRRSVYSRGAIAFHWAIGLLIILNLAIGFLHESFDRSYQGALIGFHKSTGILVIALTLGRILWRLTHRPPPLPGSVKPWEKGLAHLTHWSLYLLMIAMPLTGWLMTSAGKRKYPLDFYAVFPIPYLPVAQNEAAARSYAERHELLGWIALALLVLHVGGALKHLLLDRDNTVYRMLPWRSLRRDVASHP